MMNRMKAFIAILILALAFAALPNTSQAQNPKVIRIAVHVPLTGDLGNAGQFILRAVELAVEQLSGPIQRRGFTIEIVPFDDQGSPDVAVTNAKQIVADETILAVIGNYTSGSTIPSSEVYERDDLVMVSPSSTNVRVTDRGLRNVNRVCGRDDQQGEAAANYVAEALKVKTAAVIFNRTAYAEGVAKSFRRAAERLGITITDYIGTREEQDFNAILDQISAKKPELIFISAYYTPGGNFIKQARAKGIDAYLMGPDGLDISSLVEVAGDAVKGVIYSSSARPVAIYDEQFAASFQKKFDRPPDTFTAESYAATQIILGALDRAIEQANGMPTRRQVMQIVRGTNNFDTVLGKITFDDNGDPERATYYILEIVSSDPLRWGENRVLKSVQGKSPLTR
jgi:branched-chain amino acid transport system substrate-binding protein